MNLLENLLSLYPQFENNELISDNYGEFCSSPYKFIFENKIKLCKSENYKYTDILSLLSKSMPVTPSIIDWVPTLEEEADAYVISNVSSPTDSKSISDKTLLENDKITIHNIAFDNHIPDIKFTKPLPQINTTCNYIEKENNQSRIDPFCFLNKMASKNQFQIRIKQNQKPEKPIYIKIHNDPDQAIISPSINIELLDNSEATIFCEIIDSKSADNSAFLNLSIESKLGENSKLNFCLYNKGVTNNNICVSNLEFELGRYSQLELNTINIESNITRNNLIINMKGVNSNASLNGLYYLNHKNIVDNQTIVRHLVPNTNSSEIYKGVLDGSSKGIFNGRIFVAEDAQKINAYQSNKNLLLSKLAKAKTKPQLEIFADDVKCSHGATIGQIDEDALFYLTTKGIDKPEAISMLISSFTNEIVDSIKNEFIKSKVDLRPIENEYTASNSLTT